MSLCRSRESRSLRSPSLPEPNASDERERERAHELEQERESRVRSREVRREYNKQPTTKNFKALIAVLQKHLPLFRLNTLEQRIQYALRVMRYLRDVKPNPCLSILVTRQMVLTNTNGDAVVTFQKRIGGDSLRGVAYLNSATGGANRLLRFSCKLTTSEVEVKILKHLNGVVFVSGFPNIPITYGVFKCDKRCVDADCPEVTKNLDYYMVMNELAKCDLLTWLQEVHTPAEIESVVMQLFLAIQHFHSLGYSHNDLHLKNVLIHEIKTATQATATTYWHYKRGSQDIYVPNTGFLLVLWDFDAASTPRTHSVAHTGLTFAGSQNNDFYATAQDLNTVLHRQNDLVASIFKNIDIFKTQPLTGVLSAPWRHVVQKTPFNAKLIGLLSVVNEKAYIV